MSTDCYPGENRSLGFEIIYNLIEFQLDGKILFTNTNPGLTVEIDFPVRNGSCISDNSSSESINNYTRKKLAAAEV